MEFKATGLASVNIRFVNIVVYGVAYRGDFTAVFEDGQWLPFRYESKRAFKNWIHDALYARRETDVLTDATPAAAKKIVALCLDAVTQWAKDNQHELVNAELSNLRRAITATENRAEKAQEELDAAQEALDAANHAVLKAYTALELFKREHKLP
jgi:hypothetical protein